MEILPTVLLIEILPAVLLIEIVPTVYTDRNCIRGRTEERTK
jgi:hypothetical protein